MEEAAKDQYKKTGTTTIGLVCSDGVILAADKRATMGYYIANKQTQKIYLISDRIAMTLAGGVGDAQNLVRWMRAEIKLYELKTGKRMAVEGAATLLANILSQYKFFPFFVQLLVGGVDGRPRVFNIDMLGGVTEEDINATGSGSPIAMGLLEQLFKHGGTVEENIVTAAKSVDSAMRRDAGSGEGIDMVIIKPEGVERLDDKDVKKLLEH